MTGGASRKQFKLFDRVLVYLSAIAGSARLALLTGAVILPWHNVRDKDGGLRLTIDEPIGPFPEPEGKIDDQYPEFINLCEKLRCILEGWIKENPEQWTYWDRLHLRLVKRVND
jgi:lauroyl/myristoyl acyltransferase